MLPFIANKDNPNLPLAGLLIVWPFVFDSTFTFLRRLRQGDNIFTPHRSHLYQRLVIAGHSHRFVTILYMALASISAIVALIWVIDLPAANFLSLVIPATLCLCLWQFVSRSESR